MKKTDIGVCAAMYGVCLFFLTMTLELPKAAQIYPLCIIVLLAALTTLQAFNMLRGALRARRGAGGAVTSGLEDFKDFVPRQFFPLFALIIGYLVLMPYVGFYLASTLFIVVSLVFLRVKWWQILLSAGALLLLVYGAFTVFLGVRLPVGSLFL
ncbi:MAG: tripartite tricarboxylate transporter TctB family protein [Synergistaceae bacterium]|nr:tripartite tricarboxylate transporter TctB family protein [Synergistaceae bacterium]